MSPLNLLLEGFTCNSIIYVKSFGFLHLKLISKEIVLKKNLVNIKRRDVINKPGFNNLLKMCYCFWTKVLCCFVKINETLFVRQV